MLAIGLGIIAGTLPKRAPVHHVPSAAVGATVDAVAGHHWSAAVTLAGHIGFTGENRGQILARPLHIYVAIAQNGRATSPEQALALLENELQPNDWILLSTSGNMGGLIESVPKLAEQKFPA